MTESQAVQRVPLHDLHQELNAKFVPFAGYSMPVQYAAGIMTEHRHTREKAGLFDVSHMGQVILGGDDADQALESLVCADIKGLKPWRQRYALFTSETGGILDDLMVSRIDDGLFVVVNAACKEQDLAHMTRQIGGQCRIEPLENRALLALQGPSASQVLSALAPETGDMRFMDVIRTTLAGAECLVSRSGYSGEDGYEISVPAESADQLARQILENPDVLPIGLGARDSLRLEAGLCLYGHDLDTTTTPVEGALNWAIGKARKPGGPREGGYPGADIINGQLNDGCGRLRVGIQPVGKAPVREGAVLVEENGDTAGSVTSGSFGPSAGKPVAMGYVRTELAKPGTELNAMVRDKPVPVVVASLPFVPHNYYRGASKK